MRVVFIIALVAVTVAAPPGRASGAPGDLLYKITAPEPEAGARFGTVVAAVDGDILVGEPARLHPTLDAPGQAYLFDGKTGALKWTFNHPNPIDQDVFAHALTGGDGRVFISTSGAEPRVYGFSTKTGQLLHTIYEPERPGGGNFGASVAYGSGSLLVSNPSYSVEFRTVGRAYVFDAATGLLQRTFPNPEPKGGDGFGSGSTGSSSLSLFANRALVGARLDDLSDRNNPDWENAGRVWMFDRSTGQTIFTLDNPHPEELPPQFLADSFGQQVVANEQIIAVGAINDDTSGVEDSGTVWLC
jgi:outer membrane protein assembly factor BamB